MQDSRDERGRSVEETEVRFEVIIVAGWCWNCGPENWIVVWE